MTRKDYRAIAGCILDERNGSIMSRSNERNTILRLERLACQLSDVFKTDNPNFDRDRFMKACGF